MFARFPKVSRRALKFALQVATIVTAGLIVAYVRHVLGW